MKYLYERSGGPLIQWSGRNSAPSQSRAADAAALGSLGDPTLPVPGGFEPLNGVSCKCSGSCGCDGGVGDTTPASTAERLVDASIAVLGIYEARKIKSKNMRMVSYGLAAYFAYKAIKG